MGAGNSSGRKIALQDPIAISASSGHSNYLASYNSSAPARRAIRRVGSDTLIAVLLPSGDVLAASRCYPRGVKLSHDDTRVFVFSPQHLPRGNGGLFILDAPSLAPRETIDLGAISTANLGNRLAFRIVLDSREKTACLHQHLAFLRQRHSGHGVAGGVDGSDLAAPATGGERRVPSGVNASPLGGMFESCTLAEAGMRPARRFWRRSTRSPPRKTFPFLRAPIFILGGGERCRHGGFVWHAYVAHPAIGTVPGSPRPAQLHSP